MFCTSCGNKMDETASFCPKCGAKKQADTAATVAESPTPDAPDAPDTHAATPSKPAPTPLAVGDSVFAKGSDGYFGYGSIIEIKEDQAHVRFLNGNDIWGKGSKLVEPSRAFETMDFEAIWDDAYYRCKILDKTANTVKVRYVDDGIVSEVGLSEIRAYHKNSKKANKASGAGYDAGTDHVEVDHIFAARDFNIQRGRGTVFTILLIITALMWIFSYSVYGITFSLLAATALLLANGYFVFMNHYGVLETDGEYVEMVKRNRIMSVVNIVVFVLVVLFTPDSSMWLLIVCLPDAFVLYQANRILNR